MAIGCANNQDTNFSGDRKRRHGILSEAIRRESPPLLMVYQTNSGIALKSRTVAPNILTTALDNNIDVANDYLY